MTTFEPRALSAHLLRALAAARLEGRTPTFVSLAREVGARRSDVRAALTRLHHDGAYDALRARPTLAGFALGLSLLNSSVKPLRRAVQASVAA